MTPEFECAPLPGRREGKRELFPFFALFAQWVIQSEVDSSSGGYFEWK